MLTGGRITRHLYNWHDDNRAILFLPGYQGKGTPGRSIQEGNRQLLGPQGEVFDWAGEVWTSEAFSSHADQKQLMEWIVKNNKVSKIFLLHGEEKSKIALKDKLNESGLAQVEIPVRGSIYDF